MISQRKDDLFYQNFRSYERFFFKSKRFAPLTDHFTHRLESRDNLLISVWLSETWTHSVRHSNCICYGKNKYCLLNVFNLYSYYGAPEADTKRKKGKSRETFTGSVTLPQNSNKLWLKYTGNVVLTIIAPVSKCIAANVNLKIYYNLDRIELRNWWGRVQSKHVVLRPCPVLLSCTKFLYL